MLDAQPEVAVGGIVIQRRLQLARGILAEHQVLSVAQRELLLVLAFHRSLDRGADRGLQRVDQGCDGEVVDVVGQLGNDLRHAPLAVRRRHDALLRAQPLVDVREVDGAVTVEPVGESLLDQLAGQRGGAGTSARVQDLDAELQRHLAIGQRAFNGYGVRTPTGVV